MLQLPLEPLYEQDPAVFTQTNSKHTKADHTTLWHVATACGASLCIGSCTSIESDTQEGRVMEVTTSAKQHSVLQELHTSGQTSGRVKEGTAEAKE